MVDTSNWRPIEPKVKTLWRLAAVFNGLIFGGIAIPLDFLMIRKIWEETPIPPLVIPAAVAVVIILIGVSFADAKHKNFRFRIGDDDLALSTGIFFKTQRFINRARIQHVDINTNFMSQWLGLTEIQVHVGAQMGAAITISGLRPEDAELIRRTLLEGSMVRYQEAAEPPPQVEAVPAPPAQPLWTPPAAPPVSAAAQPPLIPTEGQASPAQTDEPGDSKPPAQP